MFRIVSLSFLFALLAGSATCICWLPPFDTDYTLEPARKHISPKLMRELDAFGHLIPEKKMQQIVIKYFVADKEFRETVMYLNSTTGEQLIESIINSQEFEHILEYLHMLVNSTENLDYDDELMPDSNDWQIPFMNIATYFGDAYNYEELLRFSSQRRRHLKSFTSFAIELVKNYPREKYVQLVIEKRKHSAVYRQFYAALRSPRFPREVNAAITSKNSIKKVAELKTHGIDLKALMSILYGIINWGPL